MSKKDLEARIIHCHNILSECAALLPPPEESESPMRYAALERAIWRELDRCKGLKTPCICHCHDSFYGSCDDVKCLKAKADLQ